MYNSVLRGYLNYYKFAHNYGKLVSTLVLFLKASCAKLLAAKYSLDTMSKAYRKFGPLLSAPAVPVNSDKSNKGKTKRASFFFPSYAITTKFLTKDVPVVLQCMGPNL